MIVSRMEITIGLFRLKKNSESILSKSFRTDSPVDLCIFIPLGEVWRINKISLNIGAPRQNINEELRNLNTKRKIK